MIQCKGLGELRASLRSLRANFGREEHKVAQNAESFRDLIIEDRQSHSMNELFCASQDPSKDCGVEKTK